MSKFLKVVVNIILISAIVVAAGLLIPPFAGVTTVIVDDIDMDTNLARGSVTYAVDSKEGLKAGNKVLVNEGESQYVYKVTAVNGESYTLEDKLSTDGGTQEKVLGSSAKKVLFTVPVIGYVSMALRTTEGLIVVGLSVVFVIILFILAEIWKNDDDDEEDEESEDAYEEDIEEEEEEPRMSRRQQKKAAKKAAKKEAKKAAKEAKKAAKKAEKKAAKEEEKAAKKAEKKARKAAKDIAEETEEEQNLMNLDADVMDAQLAEEETQDDNADLFEEMRNSLAADIAGMMGQKPQEIAAKPEADVWEEEAVTAEVVLPESEPVEEKKLAMPVYTKEELLNKAKAAGDEPHVVEDEVSGVTLLDYSDIL